MHRTRTGAWLLTRAALARLYPDALVLIVPEEAVFEEIERSPCFARRIIAGLLQVQGHRITIADRQRLEAVLRKG